MLIIYGRRAYGRVKADAGEHACTVFAHVYFLPLFPIKSMWLTRELDDEASGHEIPLNGESVAAGYLRMWGPIIAIALCTIGTVLGYAAAAVVGALSIWSWTWRSVRSEAERKERELNARAFGTRCDPRWMSRELRQVLRDSLQARWDDRGPTRSPNDVARMGAVDREEAVLAYGLLRLAGVERGAAGRAEHEDADRIVAGVHDDPRNEHTPYRGDVPAITSAAAVPREYARARQVPPRWHVAGLAVLTLLALYGVGAGVSELRPSVDLTADQLRSSSPPLDRHVRMPCGDAEAEWAESNEYGSIERTITLCMLDGVAVPVVFDGEVTGWHSIVEGTLTRFDESELWVREGIRKDEANDATAGVFIQAETRSPIVAILWFVLAGGTALVWLWFLRARARLNMRRA
ncbi:MAG: hypothetical protein AB7P03_14120 [Kofleriaceae bacterium]